MVAYLSELRHRVENVGQMAEGVFAFLGSFVADVCESAKSGDIGEVVVFIEAAHIEIDGLALANGFCRDHRDL